MSYQNHSDPLQEKMRQLDEENTRLRNNLLACNDEIYSLKAVAATVEAELKYNTEQELANMESELKFKSNDLAKLSRDYEKALKELAAFKQAQAIAKRVPKTEPMQAQVIDDVDYSSYGGGDFPVSQPHNNYSQATVRKEPLVTASIVAMPAEHPKRSGDTHLVINPSLAAPVDSSVAATLSISVNPEKVSSDNVSVSSSSKGSNRSSSRAAETGTVVSIGGAESELGSVYRKLQQMSELFQRTMLCLLPVMNDLVGDRSAVKGKSTHELLQNVTNALHRCSSEVLAQSACDFSPLVQAISSVCERLLDEISNFSSESLRSALFGSLESALLLLRISISHIVAQWGRLWTQQQQQLQTEKEKRAEELNITEMAKVAGNLQSKFELAASGSAAAGARASNNTAISESSSNQKGPDRATCRIVAAIKSPYLSESQRQTLWGTKRSENKHDVDTCSHLSRTTQRMERMQQCLRQYASLLEAAIGVIGAQNVTVDAQLTCLSELIQSWGGFYAALAAQPADAVKNLFASIEAAPRKLLDRVVHLLANNSQTTVMVMVSRDGSERLEPAAAIQNAIVMAVQAFLTCSNRGFAALCAHENLHRVKGSEEQKRTDKKVKTEKERGVDLGGLIASGAIVLDGTSGNSLLCALVALLKSAAISIRDLQMQIQVVVCMENLLAKYDARFVKLLLGLSASATVLGVQGDKNLGVGDGLSGKKRHRTGSGDGSASQVNNLLPHKPMGRNASVRAGHSATNEGVSQITPSHVRKAAARDTLGGATAVPEGGGVGHRISPATGTSAIRTSSGRKLTPPTPYRDGVVQLDLQPHLASVQRALVSDLAVVWMRLIRSLDKVSSFHAPSPHAQLTVVLIMRLNALLGGIFSHLTSQDCDFVLAD
eukprot:gene17284-19702_t